MGSTTITAGLIFVPPGLVSPCPQLDVQAHKTKEVA